MINKDVSGLQIINMNINSYSVTRLQGDKINTTNLINLVVFLKVSRNPGEGFLLANG